MALAVKAPAGTVEFSIGHGCGKHHRVRNDEPVVCEACVRVAATAAGYEVVNTDAKPRAAKKGARKQATKPARPAAPAETVEPTK